MPQGFLLFSALVRFRRKPRKSWFDADKMAQYKREEHDSQAVTPDNYDVMIVDHFSRPPKIDFGDTLQGLVKDSC